MLYDNVSTEDVWKYWRTLFPEVKNEDELSEILSVKECFHKDELETFWNKVNVYPDGFMEWLEKQDDVLEYSSEWEEIIGKNKDHINNIVYPVLAYKRDEVNKIISIVEQSGVFNDAKMILFAVINEICSRVRDISVRTFITEINYEKNNHGLKGDDKEKRYLFYTDEMWRSKQYVSRFYEEYKELLSAKLVVVENSLCAITEMISHIIANHNRITKELLGKDGYVLIDDIDMGLGDSHRGGRTVSLITYVNGGKVIYKPRNLGVEIGFLEYSRELNKKMLSSDNALYEMKVLDCGEYGFVEYISQKECDNETQIQGYYYRSGVLMAMLYSLNAKDIHHENMIAHGRYPVMIDLEALFHSKLEHKNIDIEKTAYEKALECIDDSVYSIGMLPMSMANPYDKKSGSVDISGFGGEDNQISPFKIMMIKDKCTDEIRLEKSDYVIEPAKNVAKYNGKSINALEYSDFVMKGFEDTYLYIMNNKEKLILQLKKWFSNTGARIIYRPTYIYTKLMFTSFHPDFMRDRVHRYVLLHRMAYKIKKQERRIVAAEIKDMMACDVPFFQVNIHTGVMRDSAGNKLPVEFKKTPFDMVTEKIEQFDLKDLGIQKLIIESAFLTKNVENYRNECMTNTKWSSTPAGEVKYLDIATTLADRILDNAKRALVDGKEEFSWINFTPVGEEHISYEYTPVENDLYGGNSGIGLFFLYLWKISRDSRFYDAAYACIRPVMRAMKNISDDSSYLVGPYNGLSGYVYVFSKFYLETADVQMYNMVRDGLIKIKNILHRDLNYDVISGAAGALKVCISICKNFNGELKDIAYETGGLLVNYLINNKLELKNGQAAWRSGVNDHIYVGYAHGSCGIEEALADAYELYPYEEIKDTLYKSNAFVKDMYVEEKHNWRTVYGKDGFSNAWCHGAVGILYSKIKQWNAVGGMDEELKGYIRDVAVMRNNALGNNICYCHGDVGNLEIIADIAQMTGDEELKKECECTYDELANNMIDYVESQSLLPYGMMLGISGAGYSLLRKISDSVPSILKLE